MKFLLILIITYSALSQDKRFQAQKEDAVIDYSSIRTLLKKDGLGEIQKNKEKKLKSLISAKKNIEKDRSFYPSKNEFFSFFSKYWLSKNASLLRWDFPKPDYGIAAHFKEFLEKIGLIERKFSIMVINTPEITHFALPSNPGEYIFILSLPFMKSLDLSKEDISLILLEDMLRIDEKLFVKAIELKLDFVGGQIKKSRQELQVEHEKLLKEYDRIIFKRGFNFGEQFNITKKMDAYLKPDPMVWSNYIKLLNKINKLVKTNNLYKKYNKIYPSPQMQIKWLSPEKKVL